MDPRRVLIFRTVVRNGTIGGGARELGWTQPAVSQHLARLEREAGSPLLLRGSTGVRPTEAGEMLARRADVLAAEVYAASEELAALGQLRAGRVRLVAFPSAAATIVPDALAAMARDHPQIAVGLEVAEPPEAIATVNGGDADLALTFGYDGPPEELGSLIWRRLMSEPVHLVVPPNLTMAQGFGLSDLAEADWIGGCVRCRRHLVQCCESAGFAPTLQHTTDDYVVVQNLVARGLGVTMLPESALTAYRHPGVQVIHRSDLGRREVGVVLRSGAEAVPATAALLARLGGEENSLVNQ